MLILQTAVTLGRYGYVFWSPRKYWPCSSLSSGLIVARSLSFKSVLSTQVRNMVSLGRSSSVAGGVRETAWAWLENAPQFLERMVSMASDPQIRDRLRVPVDEHSFFLYVMKLVRV